MCYQNGSLEQVTSTCVMCKLHPPRLGCPHLPLSVCRNRANHPRFDVAHFRNAELNLFNGCGYCKWMKSSFQSAATDNARHNTGYPGCCRPPRPNEYGIITSAAEWYAISIIHAYALPVEIQQHYHLTRSPPNSRKQLLKTAPMSVPSSPDKGSERDPIVSPSSPPSGRPESPGDPSRTPKRRLAKATNRERSASVTSKATSPRMNHVLQNGLTVPAVPLTHAVTRIQAGQQLETRSHNGKSVDDLVVASNGTRSSRQASSAGSSGGSDPTSARSVRSGRSGNDTATITSDGFTDYLSDESDQELQRQAEVKAVELEIAKQEKAEFDAALQNVRHLCLQPPPEWKSSGIGNGGGSPPNPIRVTLAAGVQIGSPRRA